MAGASSSLSTSPSSSKDVAVEKRSPRALAKELTDKNTSAKLKRSLEWHEVRIPEATKKFGLQALYIKERSGLEAMGDDDYDLLKSFCKASSSNLTSELAKRELTTDGKLLVKLERLVRYE